jgi:phospholipid transport system transporter-binding protein
MNNGGPLSLDPNGLAQLTGPLTLETVTAIFGQAKELANKGMNIAEVDLGGVTRVDSSGLALLLEWQATAHRQQRTLRIHNAPPDLLSLAKLCEAGDLLAIEGRNR